MGFFIGCVFGVIVFSILAEKKESKIFLFLAIVLLICVTGLRAESVGIDTKNYYREFRLIANNSPFVSVNDAAFISICKFLMRYLSEYWMLIFLFSSIISIMMMVRLWDLRSKVSFSCAVILFLILHLTAAMNIMRQYIGVSIVFFASRYLDKKSIVKFIVGVVIACCFHMSTIIGLAYIPIYILCSNNIKNKLIKLFLILATIVPVGVYAFLDNIDRFSFYINNAGEATIGIGFAIKLLILMLFWIACVQKENRGENKTFLSILGVGDGIYLAMSTLGVKYIYLNRIALPFAMCEVLLFAVVIFYPTKYQVRVSKGKTISLYALPVAVLLIYVILQSIIDNGHGVFPYIPFWQM